MLRKRLRPSTPEIEVILDSGAFSAWTRKQLLPLQDYIEYCLKAAPYVSHVVNMDVIPAEYGRKPTAAEVEDSAERGWMNFQRMRRAGLNVMPVFHQGERFEWLERMMGVVDYVGISPANDRGTNEKREWLDHVFTFIGDDEGWPKVKTHGFGVTSLPLLFRYPWYSCDSTSWALFGAYGQVLVPKTLNGEFVYDRSPHVVAVSDSGGVAAHGPKHVKSFPIPAIARMEDYLQSRGSSIAECAIDYRARDRVNVGFFLEVEANKPDRPFRKVQQGFFQ